MRKVSLYRELLQKSFHQADLLNKAGPKYPPLAAGIECKPLEDILASQIELLRNIDMTTETGEVFEKRYWPAIERYACNVHLLPASEDDHHCGPGGLLHHGLEVGLFTMQLGKGRLYGKDMGAEKRDGRERWLFACFLAGLCHDLGKIVFDMRVTSDTNLVWSPFSMSLIDWGTRNRLKKYFVDWQPNRHQIHEKCTWMMLGKILTDEDKEYIAEVDHDVLKELIMVLEAPSGQAPPPTLPYSIGEMLKESDSRSVQEDQRESRAPVDLGLEKPKSNLRHFHDAMVHLFKQKIWKINEPGGAAWVLGPERDLYLVWPRCGIEIHGLLLSKGIEGVPADPKVIAETLYKNDLIMPASERNHYWHIKPANLEDAPLTALRISAKWAPGLVNLLPPGLNGLVQADAEMSSWSYVEIENNRESTPEYSGLELSVLNSDSPLKPVGENSIGTVCNPASDAPIGQPEESTKANPKRVWHLLRVLTAGTCIGVLSTVGCLIWLGKRGYPDLSFPTYLWMIVGWGFDSGWLMRFCIVAIFLLGGLTLVPLTIRRAQEKAEAIVKEAYELKEEARNETNEEKARIKEAARKLSEEASLKVIWSKAEAAEIRERAEKDARTIVSEARNRTKDLWSWAEAKAKEAKITPEEWKVVKLTKNKAQEEARRIVEAARREAVMILAQPPAVGEKPDQQENQAPIGNVKPGYRSLPKVEESTSQELEWEAFLTFLWECYGQKVFLVSDLQKEIYRENGSPIVLPASLGGKSAKSIGKAFARKEGVYYGEDSLHLVRVEKAGPNKNMKGWRVGRNSG